MTVKELINELKKFDGDTVIKIGTRQQFGSNFAIDIKNIEELNINSFYGKNYKYKAVVIIEDMQCGTID